MLAKISGRAEDDTDKQEDRDSDHNPVPYAFAPELACPAALNFSILIYTALHDGAVKCRKTNERHRGAERCWWEGR